METCGAGGGGWGRGGVAGAHVLYSRDPQLQDLQGTAVDAHQRPPLHPPKWSPPAPEWMFSMAIWNP